MQIFRYVAAHFVDDPPNIGLTAYDARVPPTEIGKAFQQPEIYPFFVLEQEDHYFEVLLIKIGFAILIKLHIIFFLGLVLSLL